MQEIGERRREGLPLTPEEIARHDKYRERNNAQFKKWRARKKAEAPPKPPKERNPTKKERIAEIIARKNAGLILTAEEQEAYAAYRAERNEVHKKWCDSEERSKSGELVIYDIQKRMRDGVALTQEEMEFF